MKWFRSRAESSTLENIIPGVTTITDIIRNAGGFLSDSDSTKFIINNMTISVTPDRELERILLKTNSIDQWRNKPMSKLELGLKKDHWRWQ